MDAMAVDVSADESMGFDVEDEGVVDNSVRLWSREGISRDRRDGRDEDMVAKALKCRSTLRQKR